jgi:protein-serine/threonine kinase
MSSHQPYHALDANEQGVIAHWRWLNRLMTWSDQRAIVEQIRVHPLFDDVEWSSLRMMPAPRPPTLKSITDTSYFPTEEYADIPEVPAGVEKLDADKDLAFLG